MYGTSPYTGRPGSIRRFNLTTKKAGVRTPNYTYAVSRPYTPRSIPNITSALSSRFNPGKEMKFFHTHNPIGGTFNAAPNVDIKTAGYFIPLLQRQTAAAAFHYIAQGSGSSQRIGSKVLLKKISFRGSLETGTHCSERKGGTVSIRFIIVEDTQAGGNVLSHADTTKMLQAATVTSPFNPIYAPRFRIHSDKTVEVNLTRVSLADGAGNNKIIFMPRSYPVNMEVRKNINLQWQGAEGELPQIVGSALYLFIISDLDSGAVLGEERVDLTFAYDAMLYYDDV